jgi:hypothetical protein
MTSRFLFWKYLDLIGALPAFFLPGRVIGVTPAVTEVEARYFLRQFCIEMMGLGLDFRLFFEGQTLSKLQPPTSKAPSHRLWVEQPR